LSSADIFRTRGEDGSSDADVRTFWCKKLRFFVIYGVSARSGKRIGPVRTRKERVWLVRTRRKGV